jgi:hypothetical protein
MKTLSAKVAQAYIPVVLASLILFANTGAAQQMPNEPIHKANLISALENGRLHKDKRKSSAWWIEQIKAYKVDFVFERRR